MASDPETAELLEPLKEFLETLSDELTQQKFIPAFRQEIASLRSAFEDLSQSQQTLEQLAHGVDRLREVFAPAGTRLLASVKDLEQLIGQNIAQLQGYAGEMFTNLEQTREELGRSLRSEAELVQESARASRQALTETLTEVEHRLADLRRSAPEPLGRDVSLSQHPDISPPGLPATTQGDFEAEWERLQVVLREGLANFQRQAGERLERLDEAVSTIGSSIGPQVRQEVESALSPLRSHLQSLAEQTIHPAEKKKSGSKERSEPELSANSVRHELSVGITSLSQKITELRKEYQDNSSEFRKTLQVTMQRYSEETTAQQKKSSEAAGVVVKSLARLEQLTVESRETLKRSFGETTAHQQEKLDLQASKQSASFGKIETQIAHAQEATSAAITQVQRENAAFSKHIEEGFRAIQEGMAAGFNAERSEIETRVAHLSSEWKAQWSGKFDNIIATLGRLEKLEEGLAELSNAQDSDRHERRETAETLMAEIGQVSNELVQVRTAQEATPAILKDAANRAYAETQERLRQVIDAGYDRFLQQISSVAQTVERYANLLESLHKSDDLALNTITSDCKSILKVASEEFRNLRENYEALKKIFPLLERRLERQLGEIGAVRRVTETMEKSLEAVGKNLHQAQASLSEMLQDQSGQISDFAQRTAQGFVETAGMLNRVRADLEHLRETTLTTLQREISDFVASKFDFMEKNFEDQQALLKRDLLAQLECERGERRKGTNWIFALVGFGILLQLLIYYITQGPLAPPVP